MPTAVQGLLCAHCLEQVKGHLWSRGEASSTYIAWLKRESVQLFPGVDEPGPKLGVLLLRKRVEQTLGNSKQSLLETRCPHRCLYVCVSLPLLNLETHFVFVLI